MKKITIILSVLLTITAFAGCNKKEDKQNTAANTAVEQTKPTETKTEDKPTAKTPEFLEDSNEQIASKKDSSVKNSTGKEFTEEEQKYVNVAVEGLKEYFSADYTKDWAGFRLNKNIFIPDPETLADNVIYFRDKQRKYITDNKLKRSVGSVDVTDILFVKDNGSGDLGSCLLQTSIKTNDSKDKKIIVTLGQRAKDNKYYVARIEDADTQKMLYLEYKNMGE